MATGYEEVREELMTWDMDDLLFGLNWELTLAGHKNFEKELILIYLDVIEKKLPLDPISEIPRSYERFKKKVLEKCDTPLPPIEIDPGQ